MERIDTHTCLGVWQVNRRLQTEPEIREFIGKLALIRHIFVSELPASDDNSPLMQIQRPQHLRNIFGIVLTVRIYRQGIIETHFHSFPEPRHERTALALITSIGNDSYWKIQCAKKHQCIVRTTVHHDNNIMEIAVRTTHDIQNGTGIVIRRYQRTYMLL